MFYRRRVNPLKDTLNYRNMIERLFIQKERGNKPVAPGIARPRGLWGAVTSFSYRTRLSEADLHCAVRNFLAVTVHDDNVRRTRHSAVEAPDDHFEHVKNALVDFDHSWFPPYLSIGVGNFRLLSKFPSSTAFATCSTLFSIPAILWLVATSRLSFLQIPSASDVMW